MCPYNFIFYFIQFHIFMTSIVFVDPFKYFLNLFDLLIFFRLNFNIFLWDRLSSTEFWDYFQFHLYFLIIRSVLFCVFQMIMECTNCQPLFRFSTSFSWTIDLFNIHWYFRNKFHFHIVRSWFSSLNKLVSRADTWVRFLEIFALNVNGVVVLVVDRKHLSESIRPLQTIDDDFHTLCNCNC